MRWVHVLMALSNWQNVSAGISSFYSRSSYQWDVFSRLIIQSLGQVFIVLDQMRNVDVAKVLLPKHILADLVATPVSVPCSYNAVLSVLPVYKCIINRK